MSRTAKEVQEEFAKDFGNGRSIIWDLYTSDEKDGVLIKLKTLIPDRIVDVEAIIAQDIPVREKEERLLKELEEARKENVKIENCRNDLLNVIWAQRKYCHGDLLMSTIFVLVTAKIEDSDRPLSEALYATTFSCHPVLRIRKCEVNDDSENCCMIFVDENGRVYQNWDDYCEENNLPEGVMIVPRNGVYKLDENDMVELSVYKTPSSKIAGKTLRKIDMGVGILGLSAAVVPLGALVLPVAAPVLAVSTGICVASGMWNTGRCTAQLVDRATHEQSVNVTDRQARSSWLGVVGGLVGLGASGATYGLVKYASQGKDVSNLAQLAVNGLNVASLVTNGLGVGNGIVELILKTSIDGEDVTTFDLLQLSASLVLFTHSAYNFQYASSIVSATRDGKIGQFREGLSNRQRRMFDKMLKETIRVKGDNQGKMDVIRGLGKIPDNKYFNNIYKINKELNRQNVRPSFGSDGSVLLNNDISVDSATLRNNIQHNIGEPILNQVGPMPASYNGGGAVTSALSPNIFNPNSALRIIEAVTRSLGNCSFVNITELQNCIFNLCENMCEEAVNRLINITKEFVNRYVSNFERQLKRFLPFEHILWQAYNITVTMSAGEKITEDFLNIRAKDIIEKLKEFYCNLVTRRQTGIRTKCKKCLGYYTIVEIS